MKTIFLVILSLALSGLAHAEEVVYVRSLKADIYSTPAFSAERLATVPKGTKLVKLEEQNRWFLVQHGKTSGWVAKLLVAANPPKNRDTAIKADSEIGDSARRRASAVATAGAARGLAADGRRRQSEDDTVDRNSLKFMEDVTLSEDEVKDFIKQGLDK